MTYCEVADLNGNRVGGVKATTFAEACAKLGLNPNTHRVLKWW